MEDRVRKALEIAAEYGGDDGEHHKAYAVDQMVRALTGCPIVTKVAINARGNDYEYQGQGESDEYKEFVAKFEAGEDGPRTHEWDVGIPG